MANEYTSFYLKDPIPTIEHLALDLMGDPIVDGKKTDGTMMTLTEISNHNSLIAMSNDGVRMMAKALIQKLSEEDEDNE